MIAKSPEEAVELLDKAFNEADVETVLAFYEDAAVVVTEPGQVARGNAELRNFFERVVRAGLSAKQLKTYTLEADGIALFLSRWYFMPNRKAPLALSLQRLYFANSRTGDGVL